MAIGFKKSLFGFNCDDVLSYVEKTHKTYTEKEIVLNEKIDALNSENSALKEQISSIEIENNQLQTQLKEFTDKYDEIERLSQNIGKLYLVAKSNAETIMKEADACADASRKEVIRNLDAINNARESLDSIKENIVNTSAGVAKEIDLLTKSLSDTREKIENREKIIANSDEEYRELIRVLSNE